MERASGETSLIDRTGRMLKMEPLATVESLEQYLLKMVSNILCTHLKGIIAFFISNFFFFFAFICRLQSNGMTLIGLHLFLYENYVKAKHLYSGINMILMKMELFTGLGQMRSEFLCLS